MNARKTGTRGRPAKTGAKKAAARKPTAQRAGAKAAAKRTSAKANRRQTPASARTTNFSLDNIPLNKISSSAADADMRRPEDNSLPSYAELSQLTLYFNEIKESLEEYAQHLRSLDRRLNGVGKKKMGFIDKAFEYATTNQEFLLHWLMLRKFETDGKRFSMLQLLNGMAKQIQELLWNMTIE
jgi:hypothetical protein